MKKPLKSAEGDASVGLVAAIVVSFVVDDHLLPFKLKLMHNEAKVYICKKIFIYIYYIRVN